MTELIRDFSCVSNVMACNSEFLHCFHVECRVVHCTVTCTVTVEVHIPTLTHNRIDGHTLYCIVSVDFHIPCCFLTENRITPYKNMVTSLGEVQCQRHQLSSRNNRNILLIICHTDCLQNILTKLSCLGNVFFTDTNILCILAELHVFYQDISYRRNSAIISKHFNLFLNVLDERLMVAFGLILRTNAGRSNKFINISIRVCVLYKVVDLVERFLIASELQYLHCAARHTNCVDRQRRISRHN